MKAKGAEEMAEQLRVLAVLAKDGGVVNNTHSRQFTTTCNSSYRGSDDLFRPP